MVDKYGIDGNDKDDTIEDLLQKRNQIQRNLNQVPYNSYNPIMDVGQNYSFALLLQLVISNKLLRRQLKLSSANNQEMIDIKTLLKRQMELAAENQKEVVTVQKDLSNNMSQLKTTMDELKLDVQLNKR